MKNMKAEEIRRSAKEYVLRELLFSSVLSLSEEALKIALEYLKNNPERCIEIVKRGIKEDLKFEIETTERYMTPEEREADEEKLKFLRDAEAKIDRIARFLCRKIGELRPFMEAATDIEWREILYAIDMDMYEKAREIMRDIERELRW
ncbi:MAG: hypothetical protein DRP01_00660 [Archaeoglobales archaeon]|nr:MAG: hypothetical protein DRP01_00660 [Archaeoglobales archaeon]